jgi:N-acetylglucosamine kinase-like BadF-type ATPase
MSLFLGVDGGQTTTKVVVANEGGRILGTATGGPSNHTEEPGGPERLEQVVRSTVDHALKLAGAGSVAGQEFESACFGMTGETAIKQRVLGALIRTSRLAVVHDSVNALMGATAGKPGLIVIAGTGSVARGMDARGREIRIGGWGHLFGDEGSAYGISRQAIRAVAAELDGFGPHTQLTPVFLDRLGVRSAYELMEKYYSGEWSRDHMAGLALWVNESASTGDSVARSILTDAGKDLAGFAIALIRLLFAEQLGGASGQAPIISYTGGVFENPFVLASFEEAVRTAYACARIEPPLLPPVLGSLLLAYRNAGVECSEAARSTWTTALLSAVR